MKKKTILVVEDDGYIANVLKSLLEANDYRVLSTESGSGALQLAASHVPDAVLLDLGLPDIDGTSVLSSLRMWYEGPIIVLSARHQVNKKVQALDMGANDYINKPFSASELLPRTQTTPWATLRLIFRTTAFTLPEAKFTLPALNTVL